MFLSRARRRPRWHGHPRWARHPRRGDPRRAAGRDPDRRGHADVLRPRHPRAAADPCQPGPARAPAAPTRRPPGRPTLAALDRTDHRATTSVEHRRDHGRRTEDRPRPSTRRPHRHRPRRRDHPRDRGPTQTPALSAEPRPSRCVASRDSSHGPLPQFPSRSVKNQVTQTRQASGASRQAMGGAARPAHRQVVAGSAMGMIRPVMAMGG